MTRLAIDGGSSIETSQITISTWVYISSKAVQAMQDRAKTIEPPAPSGGQVVLGRFPIMEFGNSIEPRVGVGIGFQMVYEHYLGQGYWFCNIGAPSWPDYLGFFWIGGLGADSMDGWYPFATGIVYPSVSYWEGWQSQSKQYLFVLLDGVIMLAAESAFYPLQTDPGFLQPIAAYSGFSDMGILPFGVMNKGFGQPFAVAAYNVHLQYPTTWIWQGDFKVSGDIQYPRVSIRSGEKASRSKQVNTKILFTNFYPSEFNWTMVDVPTPIVGGQPKIRVDTGGTGKYWAFGQLVVIFDEHPNVTYGKPAIPSALYYDGNINFLLTSKWPEQTTTSDKEIVNTLTFTGSGSDIQFKLDSWNHIFFTCDLSTMVLSGGQDDPTAHTTVETLGGTETIVIPLQVPDMATPPRWAMLINGKQVKPEPPDSDNPNPAPQFTVYPSNGGHWKDTPNFKMALGQIGLPIITQEEGRYKVTGPNQDIEYAYTHVWFNKYIEPTKTNLSKFFWKSTNKDYNYVIPPPDKRAAVKAFGTPDVWLYRDKAKQVEFQNLGGAGKFAVIGTKPKDFRPGPGQPKRKGQT